MRAVVMAGGLGTRLRPLTLHTPKAMLPVAGRPVIDRLLEKLAEAGIQDVTLATGYLAEQIEAYVQDGARWGLRVDYVRQVQPMGTAGALSLLADKSQPVLVVNGDKVIEKAEDIRRLVSETPPAVATVEYRVPYGVVSNGYISEKPVYNVVAGMYSLTASLLETVRAYEEMPNLLARSYWTHQVACEGYVLDIGTQETYQAAQERLAE